jgi:hypothetical protein
MEQSSTPLNKALAQALSARISSELAVTSGRSAFWKAIGFGFIGLGMGAAVGIGLYGYSLITRNSDQMTAFSFAFQKALSKIEFQGTAVGKVELNVPQLTLAKGATVSIDPSSRLLIDPNAKVTADGEIRVHAPSISIPRSPSPKSLAQSRTISNFTVFKTVPFDRGDVVTGWNYLTSAQEVPTQQYCYYHQRGDNSDVAIQINLANDGIPDTERSAPKSFDYGAATVKCVWFNKGQL